MSEQESNWTPSSEDPKQTNTQINQPKVKKQSSFGRGFLGGIVGGACSLVLGGLLAVNMGLVTLSTGGTGTNSGSVATTATSSQDSSTIQTQNLATSGQSSVTSVVNEVKNAVVSVINKQTASTNSIFGATQSSGELVTASEGSGVIYKVENNVAYIVTNNHVVEGSEQVEILLSDGTKVDAEVVGLDKWTDLAVLKMDASKVTTVASFGDSDQLQVGETAIAIGSPLGTEFATSVTQGIISANHRSVETDVDGDGTNDWTMTAIQTDAAINPGNSGGALVNAAGQVIGINTMKISSVEGMGFAIPSNDVVKIISELETSGKITRPVLGVTMYNLTGINQAGRSQLGIPDSLESGVILTDVIANSAAEAAGLQQYDVVTAIDGKAVDTSQNLRKYLYDHKVGDTIEITYYRNGVEETTQVTLTGSTNPSL